MKITSDQIRAARALLRLNQAEVAKRAGVSAVTVRRIEAGETPVGDATVAGVAHALEEAGVEFVERGVRQKTRTPEDIAAKVEEIMAIVRAHPVTREDPPFTEADLYDQNGLPA
jgi:transcriptional regulator with XRE-family HTH domain